jgi:glutamine cyclotransferase
MLGSQIPCRDSKLLLSSSKKHTHDRRAFTQGLVFYEGYLYEGTGLYGGSSIRKVDIATGEVLKERHLPDQYFGEGFVYDLRTFEEIRRFYYKGEGWGLTHNGTHFIMSDGSAALRYLEPDTMVEIGKILACQNGDPVIHLNELQWIGGEIHAIVWRSERIARIDPSTGNVTGWTDASNLCENARSESNRVSPISPERQFLSGLAHDPAGGTLYVTGKCWPSVYEIGMNAPHLEVIDDPTAVRDRSRDRNG